MSRPKTGFYSGYFPPSHCRCDECGLTRPRADVSEVGIGDLRMRRMCSRCKTAYQSTGRLAAPINSGLRTWERG